MSIGRRIFLAVFFTAAFLCLILTFLSWLALDMRMKGRIEINSSVPEDFGFASKTILMNTGDGIPLKSWLFHRNDPKALIILVPDSSGFDVSALLHHVPYLFNSGYSVLALDTRGLGRSGGNERTLGLKETDDIGAALEWSANHYVYRNIPVVLFGWGAGGAASISAAALHPEVDGIISVGAYADLETMILESFSFLPSENGIVVFMKPFLRLAAQIKLGITISEYSPVKLINRIPLRPLMIIHPESPHSLSPNHAYRLADAAYQKCEFYIMPGDLYSLYSLDNYQYNPDFSKKILMFLEKNLIY